MGRAFLILPLLCIHLTACGMSESERAEQQRLEQNAAPDSFGPHSESGEIRARHTDSEGVTTTLRTGQRVVAALPEPFTLYPGADLIGTTVVEHGKSGKAVTVDFTTKDARDAVLDHYRQQARTAQIDPAIDINADNAATLAGRSADGTLRFTLHLSRENDLTRGQLSVSRALD